MPLAVSLDGHPFPYPSVRTAGPPGFRNFCQDPQWLHLPSYILVRLRHVAGTPWPQLGQTKLA